MADTPKGPDIGRMLKYDQRAFVQRLVMGMVLSPRPTSPLAKKYPNPLERRRVGEGGRG